MDKSVWLRYDKVERSTWLVSRSQTAFTVKAVWLRETSAWQHCCVSAEFIEKLQGMRNYNLANCICCRFQESASVQLQRSHCYRHAQASSASFLSRIRAPLMWQSMHLSLRPIQTIIYVRAWLVLSDQDQWCPDIMSKQLQDLIRSTPLPPLHYVLCIMCVVKSHMHTLSHWGHWVHAESLLHNHVQIRHVLSCIIHGIVLYRTI